MSDIKLEHARLIGTKLRAVRQQRQVSLRELAQKADISASMLSQIETGKAYPSVRSIYDIAAALGLPVDYFFPDQIIERLPSADGSFGASGELTASEMRKATINGSTEPTASESIYPGAV